MINGLTSYYNAKINQMFDVTKRKLQEPSSQSIQSM